MALSRQQLAHTPGLPADSGGHRGSAALQRPMTPGQVVARHEQGDRRAQVIALFAEARREPRKPARHHAHVKIDSFDVTCANLGLFRSSGDNPFLRGYYGRRRVPPFAVHSLSRVRFNKHRVINLSAEVGFQGGGISVESVR